MKYAAAPAIAIKASNPPISIPIHIPDDESESEDSLSVVAIFSVELVAVLAGLFWDVLEVEAVVVLDADASLPADCGVPLLFTVPPLTNGEGPEGLILESSEALLIACAFDRGEFGEFES